MNDCGVMKRSKPRVKGNNILDGPRRKGETMDTLTGQRNFGANPSIQSQNDGLAHEASPQCAESVFRNLPAGTRMDLCGKILASSFRRLLVRIRSIRAYKPIDFGPALRCREDGSWHANERTDARSKSIDMLLAKYPWADIEDARMFLEGFDAGEKWALGTLGK
jgi:hypothetical protein